MWSSKCLSLSSHLSSHFFSLHFYISSSLSLFISLDFFSLLSCTPLCCCCDVAVLLLCVLVGWLVGWLVLLFGWLVLLCVVSLWSWSWRVWCGTLKTPVCTFKTYPCVPAHSWSCHLPQRFTKVTTGSYLQRLRVSPVQRSHPEGNFGRQTDTDTDSDSDTETQTPTQTQDKTMTTRQHQRP